MLAALVAGDVVVVVAAVVVVVAVVVVADFGELSPSTMAVVIALKVIPEKKMPNPIAILGYLLAILFNHTVRELSEFFGGLGGGIDGGGGSLISISSYKTS